MRATRLTILLIAVAVPAGDAGASSPGDPIRPESRVWITGASNIRRFTCTARQLAGAVDLRGATTGEPVLSGENASTGPSLTVIVDALDCGIGVMNRHLRDALHRRQHPSIEFRLTTYAVDLQAPAPAARLAGQLTIAGVQRPVATTATIRADSLGLLHIAGTYVIRPTDFGVTPPRRFGGLLRVRNRATVHFDIVIEPDGGTIDDAGCRVLQPIQTDLERESIHASYS